MLKRTLMIALFALAFAATNQTRAYDPWPSCLPCPDGETGLTQEVR